MLLGEFVRREFGRGQVYTYILLVMVLGFILSGCVADTGSGDGEVRVKEDRVIEVEYIK